MNGRPWWRYRTPTEGHAGVPLCGVGAPGVARQRGGVGERQALTPQNADRVIVAGERVERGGRGAGGKASGFFGMLRARAQSGKRRGRSAAHWCDETLATTATTLGFCGGAYFEGSNNE
jgi:hypothetical protein